MKKLVILLRYLLDSSYRKRRWVAKHLSEFRRRGKQEMYQRGDTLKLSKEGLDWLVWREDEAKRAKLATFRFEYRCPSRKTPECITVKRLGTGHYEQYHQSFLEPA